MKKIPMYLLLIAGIVWVSAGGNILRIGIPDFTRNWQSNLLHLLGAAGIFLIFMTLIFIGLCKNTTPVSWT
ncbi:hypothetical protein DW886_03700 [Enterocloster aldenensis]|uniref:hypothetical protein n=1 Tax=Enterocloster aldenensis TaxID=358742 RepID=UPI000E4D52F6|nr:hypothetical protein DW886_03700 [Enterocloster aldenensis]